MRSTRRYDDPCGIARALDVVGDRWALLVVRELLFGPKRFLKLRHGLHGISPNVLAQRLRDLEAAGIVKGIVLEPPADLAAYALTDRGYALKPILVELGRWGSREQITSQTQLTTNALFLALEVCYLPESKVAGRFTIQAEGEWFKLTLENGIISTAPGHHDAPTATLVTDVSTLRSVAFGRETIPNAERQGRLDIAGDRRVVLGLPSAFRVPNSV